jgi:hypothetical protein
MFNGIDADSVAAQAGGVIDAADVPDRCRNLEAAEIEPTESNTRVNGSRLEGKRDFIA